MGETGERKMKLLGITDTVTTCGACNKPNLKKTIALETREGAVVYYGSDCAAKALLGKKSAANKCIIERRAAALVYAHKAMLKWGTTKQAALAVWDSFGYCAEIRGTVMYIALEQGVTTMVWPDGSVQHCKRGVA
jgi:hypothetical protein